MFYMTGLLIVRVEMTWVSTLIGVVPFLDIFIKVLGFIGKAKYAISNSEESVPKTKCHEALECYPSVIEVQSHDFIANSLNDLQNAIWYFSFYE